MVQGDGMMMNANELENGLAHFTGSETCFKHSFGLVYTEGVRYLAENAECYWLIDIVASYQPKCKSDKKLRDFQSWTLKVWTLKDGTKTATVVCQRDSDDLKPMITQDIESTNFPLPEVKLWVRGGVLLLPSEY